ncbi:MAG: lysophospholipid acyltransferase family protein [Myxococcota bacterium]
MCAAKSSRTVALARTAGFVGYTSGTLLAYELHERLVQPEARTALLEDYRKRYCRHVLRLFGIDWSADVQPLPADGPRLVVSNHRAVVDIALLLALFGGHVLSRSDVGRWPLLGRVTRRAGTIFVDRGSQRSGASAIRAIRRQLIAGSTVIVFPEGTTHTGDRVRPFRPGAFAAVRGLPVEIVPVGLAHEPGTEYVGVSFGSHLASVAGRPRSRVSAVVGAPLAPEGRTAELAERSQRAVQALVHEARARLAVPAP